MGRKQFKCHGDENRFEAVADFIHEYYGATVKYIADVAGGQGLLSRVLKKRYNYESEVIDPRGFVLKGVSNRACEYSVEMASYYDLIVGLHPDEATKPVVHSALIKPILVVPCCNHWNEEIKLSSKELILSIEDYLKENDVSFERTTFNFKGPKNIGIITK